METTAWHLHTTNTIRPAMGRKEAWAHATSCWVKGNRYLSCLHFLANVNKAAGTVCAQDFIWMYVFISPAHIPRHRLAGSYGNAYVYFLLFKILSLGGTWVAQWVKDLTLGQPRWCSGLAPPAARAVILETWDQVPCRAPCMEPASPSVCVSACLSLSLSWINK